MKKRFLPSIAALSLASTMTIGMSVPALADVTDYAKFCKDGSTEISMTQMAVDGTQTITVDTNGTDDNTADDIYSITIPLDGFHYTKWGVSADGYLNTLTDSKGNKFTAVYTKDTDGNKLKNGSITIEVTKAQYDDLVKGKHIDYDVTAKLENIIGVFSWNMDKPIDYYFSSTLATY